MNKFVGFYLIEIKKGFLLKKLLKLGKRSFICFLLLGVGDVDLVEIYLWVSLYRIVV